MNMIEQVLIKDCPRCGAPMKNHIDVISFGGEPLKENEFEVSGIEQNEFKCFDCKIKVFTGELYYEIEEM